MYYIKIKLEQLGSHTLTFVKFQKVTGGTMLKFNNAAYIALKDKADGNYAQAFYMKETKSLPSTVDLHACMDLYLQVILRNFRSSSPLVYIHPVLSRCVRSATFIFNSKNIMLHF